jgi:NAD(P)H-hydrate epimerase
MPPAITRDQSREVDRRAIQECGMSGLVLMENAGRGVTDILCRLMGEKGDSPHFCEAPSGPFREMGTVPFFPAADRRAGHVVVCCGKGNNAGDGFVIARHLDLRGHSIRVLVWAEAAELTGDAGANFAILQHCGVPLELFGSRHEAARLEDVLARADWVVDALLGTGARGEPRPPLDAVINQINAAAVKRLAVDLPSGLDCDTGLAAQHTIRADETCTFVAMKRGFLAPGAERYTGRVHVLDIGAPRRLVEEVILA